MIDPVIINGKRFVVGAAKLGEFIVTGPRTNKQFLIKSIGSWVDEVDASHIVGTTRQIWCGTEDKFIDIVAIFNGVPSDTQAMEVR